MNKALDLIQRLRVRISAVPLSGKNLGQVVHTHTHVPLSSKQYNVVPVKRQRCRAAGKVTVGLASHWPSVPSLPALGPWAPPAERGPSLESIYRVFLTVDICEG